MDKLKAYKIILVCLILAIIIISTLVGIKYIKEYTSEEETKEVIASINEKLENNENNEVVSEIDAEIKGHKVIGIIRIPKIDLKYPILETTTEETLNLSITKFWGNEINEIGNVTLAGHNNLSGVMFGKIKKLKAKKQCKY